jgi:hypothetical protein
MTEVDAENWSFKYNADVLYQAEEAMSLDETPNDAHMYPLQCLISQAWAVSGRLAWYDNRFLSKEK